MLPPCKRPRAFMPEGNIPLDLVLEIVARSDDAATVVRCAAACRALRLEILSPAFLRRVFHEPGHAPPPSRVLGFLHAYDDAVEDAPRPPAPYSLAYPATPGAASFAGQLARFVTRSAADLLDHYDPVAASRNGLVALYRRYIGRPRRPEVCVYDAMTGGHAFLPRPPGIRQRSKNGVNHAYVLLTADDGIGCSFLLLVANFAGLQDVSSGSFTVHTVSSSAAKGKWSSTTVACDPRLRQFSLQPRCSALVLGGVIHWLMYQRLFGADPFVILTYNVRTATADTIELPTGEQLLNGCQVSNLHLTSSPDGKLSLLVADKFRISVWLLLPDGAGWSRHAVINTKATVKTLLPPDTPPEWWLGEAIEFRSFCGGRSGAILVRPFNKEFNEQPQEDEEGLVVLDMETKEMRRAKRKRHVMAFPFEINLQSRLSSMKTF